MEADGPGFPSGSERVNLTLYHVNPKNYSGIVDMDTGDAGGDAFFDIRGFLVPIICSNVTKYHPYPGECYNPETDGNDLVTTRVVVEVQNDFGHYGMCNICVNGTVPLSFPPKKCVDGEYECVCGGWFKPSRPCGEKVGRENVTSMFGRWKPYSNDTTSWWTHNLAKRVQGMWYSTTHHGHNKTWRLVEEQKRVNSTCQKNNLFNSIDRLGKRCFESCPNPSDKTSECYVRCVFESMLGPDSGHKESDEGGLSGVEIVALWTEAFENCPSI